MFQSFCVVVVSSSFSIIRVFLNPSVCSDSTTFPSNTASSLCHHHPFIRTFYIFSLNLFNLNFFPFLLRKQSLLIRLLCLRFIYLQLFTHIFTSLPLYSTLLYTLSLRFCFSFLPRKRRLHVHNRRASDVEDRATKNGFLLPPPLLSLKRPLPQDEDFRFQE